MPHCALFSCWRLSTNPVQQWHWLFQSRLLSQNEYFGGRYSAGRKPYCQGLVLLRSNREMQSDASKQSWHHNQNYDEKSIKGCPLGNGDWAIGTSPKTCSSSINDKQLLLQKWINVYQTSIERQFNGIDVNMFPRNTADVIRSRCSWRRIEQLNQSSIHWELSLY